VDGAEAGRESTQPFGSAGAVVVTYNPDLTVLRRVIDAVAPQVGKGIVVDNGSRQAREISTSLPDHFIFHDNGRNLGLARALNQGVEALLADSRVDWVLTLDQDTVVAPDYVDRLLAEVIRHPLNDRIGIVTGALPGDSTGSRQLVPPRHIYTSGNLVRSSLFGRARFREEFFIDFVDCDFSFQVRAMGYEIMAYDWPMFAHTLGVSKKILGRQVRYEPSGRYYYIVRNTTVLVHERRLMAREYLRQVAEWGILVALCEGPVTALRTFLKGIGDALGGRLDWN